MSHYRVGCDAHKYYSFFAVLDDRGKLLEEQRVNHEPGAIRDYLSAFPEGTPVAIESVGNWYWIVSDAKQHRDTKPQGVCPGWPIRFSPRR